MRHAPDHIAARLRERDPLAEVRWDDAVHCWVLYWDRQRICQLFHEDGSPMLELCVDEILDIMGRYDNFNDGRERIAKIRSNAKEARARADDRKLAMMEESMTESESVAGILVRGASPQIHIQNNPIAKETQHVQGHPADPENNTSRTFQHRDCDTQA